jgi:serine/threonine protein kinase
MKDDEYISVSYFRQVLEGNNTVRIDEDRLLRIDDFVVSEAGITRHNSLEVIPCNFLKSCVFLGILGTGATCVIYKLIHVPTMTVVACKNIDLWKRDHLHNISKEISTLFLNKADIMDASEKIKGITEPLIDPSLVKNPIDFSCSQANMGIGFFGEGFDAGNVMKISQERVSTLLPNVLHKKLESMGFSEDFEATFRVATSPCPFLVSFYDAFVTPHENVLSFVMEYMDGGSLQHVVDNGGIQDEAVLAMISFQVLSGLKFLHSRGIIHRDIKPDNLLVNQFGEVKIADFGVSCDYGKVEKELKETFSNVPPLAFTHVGTRAFMSPERASGKRYDYKADIWSFGMSLLAIAMGKMPIKYGNEWDMNGQVVAFTMPDIGRFSSAFRRFTNLALENDAGARLSAETLLEHEFLDVCKERYTQRVQRGSDDVKTTIEDELR